MLNRNDYLAHLNCCLKNHPSPSLHIHLWKLDDSHNTHGGMEPDEVRVFGVFGFIMTCLLIVALIVNFVCVLKTRRIAYSRPSLYLVINLNVCDILVALMTWIQFMLQQIAITQNYELHIIVHKILLSILITLGNITILTLLGLAFDIYLALRFPLHYNTDKTRKYVRAILVLTWIVSILFGFCDFIEAFIEYLDKGKKVSYVEILRDTIVLKVTNTIAHNLFSSFTILLSNITSFLCLLFMISIYAYILIKIHRAMNTTINSRCIGRASKHAKAFHTTLMIFLSFILLWVPTLISNVLGAVKPDYLSKFSLLEATVIGYTADALLIVHSIVDGIIYGLRVERQRSIQKAQQPSMHSQKTPRDSSAQLSSVKAKSMDSGLSNIPGSLLIKRRSSVPNLDRLDMTTERANASHLDNNNVSGGQLVLKHDYSHDDVYDDINTSSELHLNPAELLRSESCGLHRELPSYSGKTDPYSSHVASSHEIEYTSSHDSSTTYTTHFDSRSEFEESTVTVEKISSDKEESDTDCYSLELPPSDHKRRAILRQGDSLEENYDSDETLPPCGGYSSNSSSKNHKKLVRISSKLLFSPIVKHSSETGVVNCGFQNGLRKSRIVRLKHAHSMQEEKSKPVNESSGILKKSTAYRKAISLDETLRHSSHHERTPSETQDQDPLSPVNQAMSISIQGTKELNAERTRGKSCDSAVNNSLANSCVHQSVLISHCTKI